MPRDPNCIFCKIVAVEVPAAVVYEDETVISFLDSGPLADGHLLIVPRGHYGKVTETPRDVLSKLAALIPPLGRALIEISGAEGLNVLANEGAAAGQAVAHLHFHLIPRRSGDGLGYRWNAGRYPAGRAEELAQHLQSALAS